MNTISIIDQLNEEARQEELTLPAHKKLIQRQIVLFALNHPELVDITTLLPSHFTEYYDQLTIAEIFNYWEYHKVFPVKTIIAAIIENKYTEEYYDGFFGPSGVFTQKLDSSAVPGIIQYLKDWKISRLEEQFMLGEIQVDDYIRQKAAITAPPSSKYKFTSLAELRTSKKSITFLCDDIISVGQPFFLYGPKKCLKTGLLCDLAISLATGTDFMGKFRVPAPVNVGYISAESGEQELVERLEDIQIAKGLGDNTINNLIVSFDIPKLSKGDEIQGICEIITKNNLQVMIIDPMYLTLLNGDSDTNAGNVLQMGPLLSNVASAIIKAGATPIFCHHVKKTGRNKNSEIELDDMSYSGFAEFARQSLAIWRREDMASITCNKMAIKTHGFRRSAAYNVDIDETTWTLGFAEREAQERATEREQHSHSKTRVLEAINCLQEQGVSTAKRNISEQAKISPAKLNVILATLIAEGNIRPLVKKNLQGVEKIIGFQSV